ncbi:MAG: ribonuclease P protein component [Tannerellaceae bacterium]|jgi:ribonuclease P protein component|nr:ribonuclease P protein component [Tannerellaceae bacterium]
METKPPTAEPANTLRKSERLRLQRSIEQLYKQGQSVRSFPFKLIYLCTEAAGQPSVSIITAVSKRNLRRANARNYIKRRIRESYRLRKHALAAHIADGNRSLCISFMYLTKEKLPFRTIDAAIAKGLALLIRKL